MNRTATGAVLLVDRGDPPSLAATMIQPDRERVVIWHLREETAAAGRRLQAARDHAELLGAPLVVSDAWHAPAVPGQESAGLEAALILLQAAIVARQQGCARIVDPTQVGPDAAAVCEAVDRATTVTDLILLEDRVRGGAGRPQGGSLVIDLPLIDLEDDQILDLADDAGAPLDACWPCNGGEPHPCGRCDGCRRWRLAFDTLGLGWPWTRSGPAVGSTAGLTGGVSGE